MPLAAHYCIDRGVSIDDALLRKSLHECLRILKIGIVPGRATEPERVTRRIRQCHIVSVAELTRRELSDRNTPARSLRLRHTLSTKGESETRSSKLRNISCISYLSEDLRSHNGRKPLAYSIGTLSGGSETHYRSRKSGNGPWSETRN